MDDNRDEKPNSKGSRCHPFFERFDRIYVINLKARADRRKEMAQQLERVGLHLNHERVRLFEAVRPSDKGDFPTIGARGCFMSHVGVLADAQELDNVLIFEDDLDFVANIGSLLTQADALFPDEWSMFYGGLPGLVGKGSNVEFLSIPAQQEVLTAHFVAMNRECVALACRLLNDLLRRAPGDPNGGPMHVDGAYNWLRRLHPELRTVAVAPSLGFQRPSRTDIHPLPLSDRLPIVRDIKQKLRRMRLPSNR